jgi:transposase
MQEQMEMGAECMSDVVLLLGQMKQMSLPDLLDHRISKYQREQRVSLGWVICIWLAYIMSKGDHRKVSVQDWVRGMRETLKQATIATAIWCWFTCSAISKFMQRPNGRWMNVRRTMTEKF